MLPLFIFKPSASTLQFPKSGLPPLLRNERSPWFEQYVLVQVSPPNNLLLDSCSPNELQTCGWTLAALLGDLLTAGLMLSHLLPFCQWNTCPFVFGEECPAQHYWALKTQEEDGDSPQTAQYQPGNEPRSLVTAKFHTFIQALICNSHTSSIFC